jgi:hypothetical protein
MILEQMEELAVAAGAKVACVRREISRFQEIHLNAIHLMRRNGQ